MIMNIQTYKRVRAAIAVFVAMTVSVATTQNSYLLAIVGVLTGMLFMIVVRRKAKVLVDERMVAVSEKAARYTYSIVTSVIGLSSFVVYSLGRNGDERLVLLGTVLSYITLFTIAVYSIAYYWLDRKFGAVDEE